VRDLIVKRLPEESRQKSTWQYVAGLALDAANGDDGTDLSCAWCWPWKGSRAGGANLGEHCRAAERRGRQKISQPRRLNASVDVRFTPKAAAPSPRTSRQKWANGRREKRRAEDR
jgi:hypothetical protein